MDMGDLSGGLNGGLTLEATHRTDERNHVSRPATGFAFGP